MIKLTRLNDEKLILNAIMIEQVEALPDTTITLINGKKLVVKEAQQQVIQWMTAYYQTIGLQNIANKAGGEADE